MGNIAKALTSVFLLSLIVLFNAPAAAQTPDRLDAILKRGTLRCGYVSYPPYFEKDLKTGAPRGLSVDLMEAIGQKMNIKIEWAEEVGWGTMIEGIKANRYDAVCSGIWPNAVRATQVEFTAPYGYAALGAWVRKGEKRFAALSALDDPSVRVSLVDGEMSEVLTASLFPKTQRVRLPQTAPFSDVLLNVVTGKADVAFVEDQVAHDFLKKNPGALKKVASDTPLAAFPFTFVLPSDEPRLKRVMDTAIGEIVYGESFKRMLAKNSISRDDFHPPALPF